MTQNWWSFKGDWGYWEKRQARLLFKHQKKTKQSCFYMFMIENFPMPKIVPLSILMDLSPFLLKKKPERGELRKKWKNMVWMQYTEDNKWRWQQFYKWISVKRHHLNIDQNLITITLIMIIFYRILMIFYT